MDLYNVYEHAYLWGHSCDLNQFEYILYKTDYNPNKPDKNGLILIQYLSMIYPICLDKLELLLKYGTNVNVIVYSDDKNMTLFQYFVEDCCSGWGGDRRYRFIRTMTKLLLHYNVNIYHIGFNGKNNIDFLNSKIRNKKRNKCHCEFLRINPEKDFCKEGLCCTHLTIGYLNIIVDEIKSFHNRKITLFELLLPQINKYKPPTNNKRQRKK